MKPFIIYKSSAGSGKTYTLTLEYLKLALVRPNAFRQILAVTFTNKATQEMKERILEYLERLGREIRPDEFLDQQLMEHLKLNAEELQKRSRETLLEILHAYGYFSVSTIDSFFQRVIRSFAREMDLQAKFDLELDQDAVLERLVDRMVEKMDQDPTLRKWLIDYAEEQIIEGKSWDIRKGVRSLGREIFQEKFKVHKELFQETVVQEGFLGDFRKQIQTRRKELIGEAERMKALANEIRLRFGLEWTDFIGGAGTSNFAIKLDKLGNPDNPFPTLTEGQKVKVAGIDSWYAKTSKMKTQIEEAAAAGLRELLLSLPDFVSLWNTLQALQKNLNAFGVFRNLISELRDLKDEEGILLISDVNDFLKEITKGNEAPFIYEKIGNQYQNFLIDEFQDTSDFQWSSFKPLIENSLASGNTNLLVGDVKQSIYRWRGGKLELLLSEVQEQIHEEFHQIKNLDENFRSLPKIIDFNNSLFQALPALMQNGMESGFKIDSQNILENAFHEVVQKVPERKRNLPFHGKIHLEFTQKAGKSRESDDSDDEESDSLGVLEKLPALVMQLQDQGYELKDIAFLVRKNQQGADIADQLMAYSRENPDSGYRFEVLSEDSLFLHKSSAVKCLLAMLHYLGNPADLVSLKTMWFYFALIHDIDYSHELFDKRKLPAEIVEKDFLLHQKLNFWLQLPLLELMEELLDFLDFIENGVDLAYISGFKEAVFDFVKKNRADLGGFLDWWELNQEKRTVKIPEDHDAMRILTIHKSKGLQFKVVIMPFLDWGIIGYGPKASILWSEFQFGDLPKTVLPLTHQSLLADSAFRSVYEDEIRLAYLDSLNMLYVAFTRAEEVIWGYSEFSQDQKGNISPKSTGNLLYQLFSAGFSGGQLDSQSFWNAEACQFDWGNWPEQNKNRELGSSEPEPLRWDYSDWKSKLKTREYAWDFSESGLVSREQRRIGVLVHEILEQSNNLEEGLQLLRQYGFEGRLDEETRDLVSAQLESLFALPEFQVWYSDSYQSLAEQGILLPGGKQKRPDRILMGKDQAIVIDFKTGEKKDSHLKQVQEYMNLVAQLSQRPVQGFLCYLEPTQIIEVYA
ncbi:UvrD-helicase domain-containing protein [Algoriphagus sp. CAU 1675]|uniref:UvrD-helicase domain-containing protein n=1 Tax=Algoriphagus sp. CAU 1675 TaxID=3032597 RepID=UPI0023DC4855|nr:UvrD-helicase domain-containing protein [Algoriphagus sp. CAU 1675]MDF2158482.1 UvrD-helicase domain-containing protein [Algoriphagus sp. CAU 1675]